MRLRVGACGHFPRAGRRYLPQASCLTEGVHRSNQFMYTQAHKNPRQAVMGTTVVGAWVDQNIASIAHGGDSRAYLWQNDQPESLTGDHSLVEAPVRAGVSDRETSLEPLETTSQRRARWRG